MCGLCTFQIILNFSVFKFWAMLENFIPMFSEQLIHYSLVIWNKINVYNLVAVWVDRYRQNWGLCQILNDKPGMFINWTTASMWYLPDIWIIRSQIYGQAVYYRFIRQYAAICWVILCHGWRAVFTMDVWN